MVLIWFALALMLVSLLTASPAKAAEFSAFARPELVRHSIDFKEVTGWKQRKTGAEFGLSVASPGIASVRMAWSLPTNRKVDAAFPGTLVVGAVTFGKKQQSQTTELTELQIESRLSTLRIEVVPLEDRWFCPETFFKEHF
jgi:hypothetical protein